MNYLRVKEIRHFERLASKKYGIPSLILMENAGRAVAEETIKTLKRKKSAKTQKIAIFCGGGNNGGDGFVAARYLLNQGYKIKVYLLKNPTEISGDALTNFTILKKIGAKIKLVSSNPPVGGLSSLSSELKLVDCIVDAIFGTGLKRKIKGIYPRVIKLINQTNKPIVSVDLPSGLNADTGLPLPRSCTQGRGLPRSLPSPSRRAGRCTQVRGLGECIQAKVTVTMGYPKKGFLNPQAKKFLGKVVVADIGYPHSKLKTQNAKIKITM